VLASPVVFVLLLISSLISSGSSEAAGPQPANQSALNGEWKLNIQKSLFANMPVPQHATLLIHVGENTIVWKKSGVDAGGKPYDYTFNGKLDDRPYRLNGASSPTTLSFKRENGALVGRWKDSHGERVSIATGRRMKRHSRLRILARMPSRPAIGPRFGTKCSSKAFASAYIHLKQAD
jgi:hypothetical protein